MRQVVHDRTPAGRAGLRPALAHGCLAFEGGSKTRPTRRHATAQAAASWSAALGAAFVLAAALVPAPTFAQEPVDGISLETAVQRALAKNYTIKIESFSVPIADAAVRESYGRFDPRVSLGYSDGTDEQPSRSQSGSGVPLPATVFKSHRHEFGVSGEVPFGLTYQLGGSVSNDRNNRGNNFDDLFSSFAGASARLPLLRGFGPAATLTTVRIARTNRSISEWEFRATVINTITSVVFTFDEVLFARARLRSALRSRELASMLFTENERRQAVGSMSEYDVLSARARVATREEDILLAERAVREVENAFKQLISDDTSAGLLRESLTPIAPAPPTEFVADVAADLPAALELRPDYRQAQLALARDELNFRFYRNQLLPAVDLEGRYGYSGVNRNFDSSRDQVSNRDYPSYSGGVTLSIPLTSTAERARYRSARFARERAEVALRQLEQDIVVRVGNAGGQIQTTWRRVLATRASRELSEQTLNAEEKLLRAGSGRTLDVLQQQQILANDEVREARAQADYRNALAEYDRQLGRTLERYSIDLTETASAPGSK